MKFIILDKKDIKKVSSHQKAMWFDIYNNDLFEDRGYDIKKMDIEDIERIYLDTFLFYVILEDEYKKFVSQARVMKFENRYTIEGLESHRDCYFKGYAKEVLKELMKEAKKRGIDSLYANIYEGNIPSIKTFLSLEYEMLDESKNRRIVVKKDL